MPSTDASDTPENAIVVARTAAFGGTRRTAVAATIAHINPRATPIDMRTATSIA